MLFPAAALISTLWFCATTPPITWKVTLDCPEAAFTDGGSVKEVLLPLITSGNGPDAGLVSETVQAAVSPGFRRFGAQAKPVRPLPALMFSVPEIVSPETKAEIVAVLPVVTADTVAAKVIVEAPAGIVTAAGTLTAGLLAVRMAVVADTTGDASVSTQEELPGAATLVGLHVSEAAPPEALRATCVDAAVLFAVAVMVARALAIIEPAAAVKEPEVCPAGIIISTGTGRSAELEVSATAISVELLTFRLTVHVVILLLVSVLGAQLTLDTLMFGTRKMLAACDWLPSVAVTRA